jgi:hypothetical protein
MKPLAFGLGVLLYGSLVAALPQSTSDVATSREEKRERTLAARISSPEQRAPVKQVNVAQLRHDAEELAQLERTIQAQIAEAERGAVPKDLGANLKKIQKLSKRLRRELLL